MARGFGCDRGTPIDRPLIERFLATHRAHIHGRVLEVADSRYTRSFGHKITAALRLHMDPASGAEVVGDLTAPDTLPAACCDAFICTQTLHLIFDLDAAWRGIARLLAPGGTALITVPGICQISRYDAERWGDCWRFTPAGLARSAQRALPDAHTTVAAFGNCLAARCLLDGVVVEDLPNPGLLTMDDPDYPVIIGLVLTPSHP